MQFDIKLLVNSIRECKSLDQAIILMEKASIKMRNMLQISPTCFSAFGYEILIDRTDKLLVTKDNFNLATRLDLSSSPKVSLFEELDFAVEFSLLITLIDGCEYRTPISCGAEYPIVSEKLQNLLQQEMLKLANSGFIHVSGLTSYSHWFLHPEKKYLILSGWESLRKIEEREISRISETINLLVTQYNKDRENLKT
jgi:hypothetical protein